MRQLAWVAIPANAAGAIVIMAALAGCSPYVYKSEITGFSTGVDQLAEAYGTGRKTVAEDRADRQRWQWVEDRAKLALTEGCALGVAGAPEAEIPCALREVGRPMSEPSASERQAAAAAPVVKALQEYAAGLAAVTNAADRQALDAAQAELKQSLESLAALAKEQDSSLASRLGPVADLFATTAAAALDARRYQVLKASVHRAEQPVAVLSVAMGDALDVLRKARAEELLLAADRLAAGLESQLADDAYARRLDPLLGKAAAIEALRNAEPKQAAAEMVNAHNELARALADDGRQIEAVIGAVRAFVDKAGAVREAFAAGTAA